jgi:copper chaperone NosL
MDRKIFLLYLVTLVIFGIMVTTAYAQDDIKQSPRCKHCGMDRQKFDYSRMLIEYDDGTSTGLCSVHCAAVELATNIDKAPKAILVGDYETKSLIDAEKAFWVLGGSKPGVMSKRGKWAFRQKENGENFIKSNGGTLASFDEVMRAAYNDLYEDTKMIREKRKMMKQGQRQEHPHWKMSADEQRGLCCPYNGV